jgi:hypothetical protein
MDTAAVANQLALRCREGRFLDAVEALYDEGVVSVEPMGLGDLPRELRGGN